MEQQLGFYLFSKKDPAGCPWEDYKDELRTAFQPCNFLDKLRDHVYEIKQGNDFDAYVKDMRLSLMQLTDMAERDKVRCFLNGLKKRTREWITFERPQTLQDAINLATNYEYSHYGNSNNDTAVKSNKSVFKRTNNMNVECNYCHKIGHYANECKKKIYDKKNPVKKTNNVSNHQSNAKTPSNNNNNNTYRPKDKDKLVNEIEAIPAESKLNFNSNIVDKYDKSVNEEVVKDVYQNIEKTFVVNAKLNGVEAKILIDTGANLNLISKPFIKKLDIIPRNTKKTLAVKLGDKTKKIITERNVLLNVEVGEIPVTQEKFVVMDISYDAILGFSWFTRNFKEVIDKMKIPIKLEVVSKNVIKKDIKNGEVMFFAQVYAKDRVEKKVPSPLEDVISKYEDIISDDVPTLKEDMKFEHVIELKEDANIPKKKMYRLTPREKDVMDQQIRELLDKGLIQPSISPYGAPVIFAKKADGSLRMCIDYRELNSQTKINRYPLPNIQDLFDVIGKAKYFTKLDLKSGYHQIRMQIGSIEITGFLTPYGHYEWLVMPFGLTNAPSTFQSIMNHILEVFLNKFVVVYLDDILIFSDTLEEHVKHVETVLKVLKDNNFTLAKKKCEWAKTEISYLGHVIGNGEIKPDDQKISIIKDWKRPENVKQVQQFIGFINYYHKFIRNFAQIAKPLFELLRKDVRFTWKQDQENAFKQLKESLLNYQCLKSPDVNRPFTVYTDASDYAIGSVLMQENDGILETVSMRSRSLRGAEMNYSTYDKELLAVHDAFKHWRCYLDGNKSTFYTDHNPLVHLFKQERLNNRQTRWLSDLWDQNMEIKYIKGKQNIIADSLSRLQLNHIHVMKLSEEFDNMQEEYENDPQFSLIWRLLNEGVNEFDNEITKSKAISYKKHFKIEDTKLFFKDGEDLYRLCLPNCALREKILLTHHDSLVGGHQGVARTYDSIVKRFYFPKMKKIVERYVRSCVQCQRNKSKNDKVIGLLNPLETPSEPWETISMDFIVRLPITKKGFDAIVVFVDKLTKRVIIRPCKVNDTAEDIARIYLDGVVREHGLSKHIISDRDTKFTSKFWRTFVELLGIKLKMSTSFHPETDGQTERSNRILQDCLRHYVNFAQDKIYLDL